MAAIQIAKHIGANVSRIASHQEQSRLIFVPDLYHSWQPRETRLFIEEF